MGLGCRAESKERDKAIAVATITATDGEKTGTSNPIGEAAGNLLSKITNAAIDSIIDKYL